MFSKSEYVINRSNVMKNNLPKLLKPKFLVKLLGISFFILGLNQMILGQEIGDYQSANSGNWESAANWEVYNGTSWTSMSSGSTVNLSALWGSSGSDVFAVGHNGTDLSSPALSYCRFSLSPAATQNPPNPGPISFG